MASCLQQFEIPGDNMATDEPLNDDDVDEPIEDEEDDEDVDALESDEASFSSSSKAANVEVIEDFSIASRQRIRDEIDDLVAAFLARGGKISEVPPNVTSDPPKKPSPDNGGRPI